MCLFFLFYLRNIHKFIHIILCFKHCLSKILFFVSKIVILTQNKKNVFKKFVYKNEMF
jgi:hypothetical protein